MNLITALMQDIPSKNIDKNLYPELVRLSNTPQSPSHHPEGDVFIHTMMVVDEAAKRRHKAKYQLGFMLAALCHDFGKPETTMYNNAKGDYTAYDHDEAGIEPAILFLSGVIGQIKTIHYVANMVGLHMKPVMYVKNEARENKWFKLFEYSVCPQDLLLLVECDFLGRLAIRDFSPIKGVMYSMLDAWKGGQNDSVY